MGVNGIVAAGDILGKLDFSKLLEVLLAVVPALVCITLHELSHGLVAYALGDDTAKLSGRLTLNPLKHLDPFGLLMMVVAHVGWAKPVPVDMRKFRNPRRGMALTALAGPVSNIVITCVFFFLYGFFAWPYSKGGGSAFGGYMLDMLQLTAVISIGYAVFNFIPVPPLDGSKVLYAFLGDRAYYWLMRYERYGMILLYVLVFTNALGGPLRTAISFVASRLMIFAQLGFRLSMLLF